MKKEALEEIQYMYDDRDFAVIEYIPEMLETIHKAEQEKTDLFNIGHEYKKKNKDLSELTTALHERIEWTERRMDQLKEAMKVIARERDRLKEHSIILNSIAWSIAAALGEIPEGVEFYTGSPEGLVERLLADRDRLLMELGGV